MALNFKDTKGKAGKGAETYTYKDGEQTLRMFGGILPRYVYWLKGSNNKDIPVECLAFNRELEKFDNAVEDPVPEFFPDKKCSWAYSVNCIDPADGKVKVLNLKKKLFQEIINAANDLGLDPTDADEGFDLVFRRTKTGPLAFNVEYTLSQLKLKKRPLSNEERALVAASPAIDEKIPRPSVEDVRKLLNKIVSGGGDDAEDTPAGTDHEAVNELG